MKTWLFASILAISACTTTTPSEAHDGLTQQEAATMASEGRAVLVDVREADEIADGMAEGAVWVPTSKIQENDPDVDAFIASLEPTKTIAVYCASGSRARRFVEILKEKGLKAENIGAYADWVRAGLPTMQPPT